MSNEIEDDAVDDDDNDDDVKVGAAAAAAAEAAAAARAAKTTILSDLSGQSEAGNGRTSHAVNQLPLHFHVGGWVDGADGERVGVGVRLSGDQIAADGLTGCLQRDFAARSSSVGANEGKVHSVQVAMSSRPHIVSTGSWDEIHFDGGFGSFAQDAGQFLAFRNAYLQQTTGWCSILTGVDLNANILGRDAAEDGEEEGSFEHHLSVRSTILRRRETERVKSDTDRSIRVQFQHY